MKKLGSLHRWNYSTFFIFMLHVGFGCTGLRAQELNPQKERSILYKIYLSKGTLDARQVCKAYFTRMSAEQINIALRDIRHFIQKVISIVVKDSERCVDKHFLINILNIHGHIIRFIEGAWVNAETKKVFFVERGKRVRGNVISLARYWSCLEQETGEELYCYKFYASCIDYLIVLLRSLFLVPCMDDDQLEDMENRWIHWLVERLGCKLDGHLAFGGYYAEGIESIRQIFLCWKDEYEKRQERERGGR